MCDNSLVGWNNIEIFLIMRADQGGLLSSVATMVGRIRMPLHLIRSHAFRFYRNFMVCSCVVVLMIYVMSLPWKSLNSTSWSVYISYCIQPTACAGLLCLVNAFRPFRGRQIFLLVDPCLDCPQPIWVVKSGEEDEYEISSCCLVVLLWDQDWLVLFRGFR